MHILLPFFLPTQPVFLCLMFVLLYFHLLPFFLCLLHFPPQSPALLELLSPPHPQSFSLTSPSPSSSSSSPPPLHPPGSRAAPPVCGLPPPRHLLDTGVFHRQVLQRHCIAGLFNSTALYYIVLLCNELYCHVLHCTVLHVTVIHFTSLYCTALYLTVLR